MSILGEQLEMSIENINPTYDIDSKLKVFSSSINEALFYCVEFFSNSAKNNIPGISFSSVSQ